ncbi:MAG: cold-shock protein [Bacteroidota bacterium]
MNGTIKSLKERGHGFIKIESESKEIFFHMNGLVGVSFEELREGDAVTFDMSDGQKGPVAINVKRA